MNNKLHSLLSFCNIFQYLSLLVGIILAGFSLNLNNFDHVAFVSGLFLLSLDEDDLLALFAKVGILGDLVHHFEQ